MTAATITGASIPLTADEVIDAGRELHRAAQQADWPEEGRSVLLRASSRLATETAICASVRDDGFTVTPGRVASARKAMGDLIAALHAYCGPEVAAALGGEEAKAA